MHAVRGSLLHCLADPGESSDASAWEFIEDGVLLIDAGRIHYRNIPVNQSLEDWNDFWSEYKNA